VVSKITIPHYTASHSREGSAYYADSILNLLTKCQRIKAIKTDLKIYILFFTIDELNVILDAKKSS